ncbi:hypothetical protein I4F81_006601 [Pyropia yezoensis]|uniref:Uncharacterized protein n=1 Tax=Pyropia yezoensis TaxID=2788 RepID=A0ACC3C2R4_PYRYE|nr:hypothetical protein I4F81_006601 [Neopyropia yezoensis]
MHRCVWLSVRAERNTYKDFKKSRQNNPALWRQFSGGDTTLDYLFSLFQNQSLILDLINPDVGESGVEGDDRTKDGKGTRLSKSTRKKKRRVDGQAEAAMEALIAQPAEMATAFKKQSDLAERTTLSQTLKNLKDAAAEPNISSEA